MISRAFGPFVLSLQACIAFYSDRRQVVRFAFDEVPCTMSIFLVDKSIALLVDVSAVDLRLRPMAVGSTQRAFGHVVVVGVVVELLLIRRLSVVE